MKAQPKKILIQQPDAETVAHLHQHILNVAPDAEVYAPANAQEIEQYYKTVSGIDLLIAEVYIEGIDALTDYVNFRNQNPDVPVLIATRYDLSSYASYIQGVPVVVLPYEEKHLESILPQLLQKMPPSELTTSISRKIPIGTQSIKLVQKNNATAALAQTKTQKAKSAATKTTTGLRKTPFQSKSAQEIQMEYERKHKMFIAGSLVSILILISIFCLFVSMGKVPWIYRYARWMELPWTDYREMAHIPAGEFQYGGEDSAPTVPMSTGEFWMDKYEVTLGQYQQFLRSIDGKNPEEFAHPDMPNKNRGFKPKDWDKIIHTIRENIPYNGVEINMNCPVFNVDWWDAYAYAKWAKKRLPSEQEWEKAARGLKGNHFVWGNDEKAISNANLGLDYSPGDPSKGGFIDGYQMVSPVAAKMTDISEFGVVGMGGNVSEWTGTWGAGKLESVQVPVIRGGSFTAQKNIYANLRIVKRDASTPEEWVGFRCCSDQAPAQ
ncbi:MAG: SUMF1/EgtB/PvdO family nonheme iron enzyme [Verrucomicrobiota bacterium]